MKMYKPTTYEWAWQNCCYQFPFDYSIILAGIEISDMLKNFLTTENLAIITDCDGESVFCVAYISHNLQCSAKS